MNWKNLLIGKWSWKRPFISLASIYILLALFAVSCADKIIFQPPAPSYSSSIPGYTTIAPNSDQPIAAIHLKAKPGKPTILFSHGNAEDIGQLTDIFTALNERGFGVIAYDYPGYGLTQGKPTEESTQIAIQKTWDYALASGIPPSSIILLGRSIGSGPSIWLASQNQPAALILISPLKSVYSIPFKYPIFPGDRYPNLKRIKNIHTPLLVIHSENDEIISFSHGKAIHEASPAKIKSLKPLTETGHNDMFYHKSDEIFDTITTFINNLPK